LVIYQVITVTSYSGNSMKRIKHRAASTPSCWTIKQVEHSQ